MGNSCTRQPGILRVGRQDNVGAQVAQTEISLLQLNQYGSRGIVVWAHIITAREEWVLRQMLFKVVAVRCCTHLIKCTEDWGMF